jgi:hypothetical protein
LGDILEIDEHLITDSEENEDDDDDESRSNEDSE